MHTFYIVAVWIMALLGSSAFASTNFSAMTSDTTSDVAQKDVIVEMNTTMGPVKILLYGDTPKHLNNFVKLVNEGYYDGVLFHRVINDFMVQTGDPNSKNAAKGEMLGMGDPSYRIEAEFVYPKHFHKRGALAAAREGDATNPNRESSGSQFYIVTGKTYTPGQLDQMERRLQLEQQKEIFGRLAKENRDSIMNMRRNRDQEGLAALQEKLIQESDSIMRQNPAKLTDEQRSAYSTVGGTPHLDGTYTVFGEVLEGMDVVDAIQKVETDRNDRPLEDIRITSMKVIGEK